MTVTAHLGPNKVEPRIPTTKDRISLHYYAGKSREDYEAKLSRGNTIDDERGSILGFAKA
jgi:hypothetical protein